MTQFMAGLRAGFAGVILFAVHVGLRGPAMRSGLLPAIIREYKKE